MGFVILEPDECVGLDDALLRIGLLLGFLAVFLQIAVFLQPLLPQQYQIAPVCETITRALFTNPNEAHLKAVADHQDHTQHSYNAHLQAQSKSLADHLHDTHHHDMNHQCQYCTVFGHLVLPPELHVKEVLIRIHVRLIAYQKAFKHVYFVLQRLYLLPQGRAPPLFV